MAERAHLPPPSMGDCRHCDLKVGSLKTKGPVSSVTLAKITEKQCTVIRDGYAWTTLKWPRGTRQIPL